MAEQHYLGLLCPAPAWPAHTLIRRTSPHWPAGYRAASSFHRESRDNTLVETWAEFSNLPVSAEWDVWNLYSLCKDSTGLCSHLLNPNPDLTASPGPPPGLPGARHIKCKPHHRRSRSGDQLYFGCFVKCKDDTVLLSSMHTHTHT